MFTYPGLVAAERPILTLLRYQLPSLMMNQRFPVVAAPKAVNVSAIT